MKQIMYIGKKPTKRDSVNHMPDRVWQGLGAVEEVTDAEAVKLLLPAYADVWMDVTKHSEEERSKVVAKLREKFRAELAAQTPAGDVAKALGSLSTTELEAELKRRRKSDGKAESNPRPAPNAPVNSDRVGSEKESVERPNTTQAVVEDIIGAITLLDRENKAHFDSDGAPVLEAVVDVLGYEVSKSELAAAVKAIKGA